MKQAGAYQYVQPLLSALITPYVSSSLWTDPVSVTPSVSAAFGDGPGDAGAPNLATSTATCGCFSLVFSFLGQHYSGQHCSGQHCLCGQTPQWSSDQPYLGQHYLARHYLGQHYLGQHYLGRHYSGQVCDANRDLRMLLSRLLVRVDDDLEVDGVADAQRGKGATELRSGVLTEPA